MPHVHATVDKLPLGARREDEWSRRKDHRKGLTDDDHRMILRQIMANICWHCYIE